MAQNRPRKSIWPAISVTEAFQIINDVIDANFNETLLKSKVIKTSDANLILDNILAEDIYAERPLPPFRASIKDGYAVIASDGAGLRNVIGTSFAEKNSNLKVLTTGNCYRINTGAPLPDGADAVVPIEVTELREFSDFNEKLINIIEAPKLNQDIREIGSDVAIGELLLAKNFKIQSHDLGILKLSNQKSIKIYESVEVSIISTGDEITDELSNDSSTSVIDTNRPFLCALFKSLNCRVNDGGIVKDLREDLKTAILNSLSQSSILVVSGGVSMGEKDYLKSVLADELKFKIHFGRVLMKPGLPTTFASGIINNMQKFVFGLPGNPVSTFVTSHLFVVPILRKLSGLKYFKHTIINVQMNNDIILDSRPEFRRACLKQQNNNSEDCLNILPIAEAISGSQISSRLLSVRCANLLLQLPAQKNECKVIKNGTPIKAFVIGYI